MKKYIRAKSRSDKPVTVETTAENRLKLAVYADGSARVYYRRPIRRRLSFYGGSAWEYVGEFVEIQARQIIETFSHAVIMQAEQAERNRRERATT